MGGYVGLRILPDCITDEEWSSFYTESRHFIAKYRPKLASITETRIQGVLATHKRFIVSQDIGIIDDKTKKPSLRIDGTSQNRKSG